jgi:hypothetical protein
MSPDWVYQAPSKLHGDGMFTRIDLRPGDVCSTFRYMEKHGPMCGFNWSARPNIKLLRGFRIRVLRPVKAGEELTLEKYR